MTGLSVLRQVYGLLEQPARLAAEDGNEDALAALNQIYGDLWCREHTTEFQPLPHLWQEVELSWKIVDPFEEYWASLDTQPEPYAPGSWGPDSANELLAQDGRTWRRP